MTLRSRSASQSALGIVALGRLLVGCFDVEQVDVRTSPTKPTPLLIDDFDDGDRQPALESLEPWHCSGLNGSVQNVRCDADPGAHSTEGRAITFDLVDVPNGIRDYQAVELRTTAVAPLDLTAFDRFVFWAALEVGSTPSTIPVRVVLYCSDLGSDARLESPDQAVPGAAPFRAYPSPMADFHQPNWQKADWAKEQRAPLDELACLAGIGDLGIYVQPDMPDGQRATGKVRVDDLYVQ